MRKLRLWLIDDRPVQHLETPYLEIQAVPNGTDLDPSLGTWAQHLRLWSDQAFPAQEPDLILIDCRFEDDHQYVPMSESLRGHDPRGLLHGAIFIARMFGRDRFHPFGFAIYSMDASGFQQDAYAQTFMGFLLAMRDATRPEGQPGSVRGRKDRELVNICSEELAHTIRQNPASAWAPALVMYRQRLREVIDLQAIVVDKESWLRCLDGLKRRADLEDLFLAWRRFDGSMDQVQLLSLFADLLPSDLAGPAIEWLESLLVLGDHLGDARLWLEGLLLEQQDPDSLPVPRGQDLYGQRLTRFFHACAATVAWYEDRRLQGHQSSSQLLLSLGLSDKQINRYFKPLLNLAWGKVVDLLDDGLTSGTWPFPGQWELLRVCQDWSKKVHGTPFPLLGPT